MQKFRVHLTAIAAQSFEVIALSKEEAIELAYENADLYECEIVDWLCDEDPEVEEIK